MNQIDTLIQNLGKNKNKKIVNNLLSQSQCHICHEILNIPMMVACGHNYCYMCLKSWFKTNETSSMGCPDCRKTVDTVPVFNLFLDHQLRFIFELVEEQIKSDKWDKFLSERKQDEGVYKTDVEKDLLFANVFKNSTLSVIDMDDDGIPRCGNCHWELDPDDIDEDDNVCPHCHFRIRNNITTGDSENVMGNSARTIANDIRRHAEEYSEGEYEEIVDDIRRFSDSDLESDSDNENESNSGRNRTRTTLHDDEAIDEDEKDEHDEEDEEEEENDSEMDDFIENDEGGEDSDDSDTSVRNQRKRKFAVLDESDEEDMIHGNGNSSEHDSDFYEHNDDEGFVSGDSLDEGDASDVNSEQDVSIIEIEDEPTVKRVRKSPMVLSDDE